MNLNKLITPFRRIYFVIRFFSSRLKDASISAYAGQAAFFMMLSFFPFFMFLLSILKYTPLSEEILITNAQILFPVSFRDFIAGLIGEIFNKQSATVLPATIITAVWLGSKAFLSLIRGLNSVYEIPESRNYVVIRLFSFLYTIVFALLILATLTVLVFGNTIYFYICRVFPILNHIFVSIISIRAVAGFLVMMFFFLIMYRALPNRKTTLFSQLPGAVTSTAGWIIFSYLYSYYIDHISNYSSFYGTMTMIAFLMVWLYACMYILFFGGLLNCLLEKQYVSDYIKLLTSPAAAQHSVNALNRNHENKLSLKGKKVDSAKTKPDRNSAHRNRKQPQAHPHHK